MYSRLRALGAFLAVVFLATYAFAALTGDLAGTVVDATGATVGNAKVTITNLATGTKRTAMTNSFGQFLAQQLDLGDYEISVEMAGFRTVTGRATIRSGETTSVDFKLTIGSTAETVTVEGAAAPALDTASSQVSDSLPSRMVTSLPNSARDPVALSTLAPGTVPVTKDNPFLGTGSFNSNGSRGRANNITVDNITSTDIATTGSSGLGTISFDSIQEVKVITNNFNAEFGRNSGAQVQIITKSGTNEYHGDLYWYHQNSAFNARDYFDTTGKATPTINNDWGFYAGGPIIKNKLFIAGHYEGDKVRGAGSTHTANVMTPAQVAGITDPTSKAILGLEAYPTDASGKVNNSAPNAGNQFSYDVKVDAVTRAGKDLYSMDYGENPNHSIRPSLVFIGTGLPNYGANVGSAARKTYFSETHTFTPRVVNQFRFAYGRSNPIFNPVTTLKQPYPMQLMISGLDAIGVWSGIPQGRTQNTFQWNDTVSWSRGRHGIKIGGDFDYYQMNDFFDSTLRGIAFFSSIADFQQGNLLQYQERFGNSHRHFRSRDLFWFAQDDFRVTNDLTLNLGVRMESSGPDYEVKNILSNIATNVTQPLGGGGTGPLGTMVLGGNAFQRNNNWAPRLGFAYNPGRGKLVFRGGYGIAYDYIFLNPITNLRFSPPYMPTIALTSFTGTNTWANLAAGTAQAQTDAIASIGSFPSTQANFGTVSAVSRNLQNPRNQQWNVGVEYEVIPNLVTKLSYVGSRNDNLQLSLPINLVNSSVVPAAATSTADEAARLSSFLSVYRAENGNASGTVVNNRLDPRFNSVTQVSSLGVSSYDSLQFEVLERLAHGLSFDANYTWGHSIDNVSDSLGVLINDSSAVQDPRNIASNRANSQFDLRQRFVLSYSWQIPFTHSLTGAAKKLLDGWQVAGVFSAQGGLPATIYSGTRRGIGDILLDGNSNVIANGDVSKFHPVPLTSATLATLTSPCARGVNTSTNPAVICTNTSNFPLTQPLLGNAGNSGRNKLRLAPYNNLDWTFIKDTQVTERFRVQFRWEIYNLMNHPNFAVLNNNLTSSTFGTYSTTANNMRQMQGGLKLFF